MAHTTGNTSADEVLTTLLNKKFVKDLEYALQHQKFCMKGNIEKGAGGNILRFIEFAPPNPATGSGPVISYSGAGQVALTEGNTGSEHEIPQISQTGTPVTVAEYGEYTKIGKLYEYSALTGTRARLEKRLLDGAKGCIDSVVRIAANTTTNALYATAGQTGGSATGPSAVTGMGAATLMLANKTLFGALAPTIDGVPGHPSGHYAAVLTPTQELDIITEVTTSRVYWNNAVVNVPGSEGVKKWVDGYIGSIYRVATYITQNYSTLSYTSSTNIGFVYGDGGVGAASFDQMEPQIILNDVNSPYKNMNSIAWHAMFGVALLRSASVVKIYSTGS